MSKYGVLSRYRSASSTVLKVVFSRSFTTEVIGEIASDAPQKRPKQP